MHSLIRISYILKAGVAKIPVLELMTEFRCKTIFYFHQMMAKHHICMHQNKNHVNLVEREELDFKVMQDNFKCNLKKKARFLCLRYKRSLPPGNFKTFTES